MKPPWLWPGFAWWLSAIGLGLIVGGAGTVGAALVACLSLIDVLSWVLY